MLRIHFSVEDLVRIRILDQPQSMWELLLSLHLVQTTQGDPVFGRWRRDLRRRLTPTTRMLTTLARPKGYSPDFLTPATDAPGLEAGLESLLSTSREQLRTDMSKLAAQVDLPPWASSVADGGRHTMRHLAVALREYHTAAVEPYWRSISCHVRADRDRRIETAATGGMESVLESLHPAVRWKSPVLEVAYPVEQDLHLEGRGLVLVPSFFCWRLPISLADQSRRPMLVYPVQRDTDWAIGDEQRSGTSARTRSLTVLMGPTRATVLQTIGRTPRITTTELARAVGISLAGASQHATVLRNAGLVRTDRGYRSAVHQVSRLGADLLWQAD
ncbi:ArsR/SmtB family transcription factor [Amycolatopsis magusensis]|uniref:DNA-binding transcriptional ArsR family regulator n=1 Tax=Amycolatopsis magusensis TaxID=882444 RepID=A0ABS4PTN4_9PSEU|nr:helix-turn-helix domain-containing protein [Amycolatopsis magusensis]MBP2182791.1 DNA-binding transcriptional ArsR family regulator [Amycolatopsis magusensis]MDI5976178.1 helix-turn-helix domain-containing protein [Amycolatopsis magusensis]